jgi:phospho-N-acetylmuramoyl-pentapeptide-transferase
MSPIHHHFEMSGWSEWKIDSVFWLVALGCSALTLFIYFLKLLDKRLKDTFCRR